MEETQPAPVAWRSVAFAAGVAGAICLIQHLLVGHVHLNLADEGYLWYGVQRALEGQVPFRDFQSYDPGRYAWCVAGSTLFGGGILGVRASMAVFQALGLTFGLLVARRIVTRDVWIIPIGLLLAVWMYPRHKVIEPAIAMTVTWFIVRLIERQSVRRALACGICIGLSAWFGRNHGVYAGIATLVTMGLFAWKQPEPGWLRRFGALAGGVLIGYSPLLLTLVFVDGFAPAFVQAVLDVATKGANLPYPWPWPWRVDWSSLAVMEAVTRVAIVLAFLVPIVVPLIGIVRIIRLPAGEVRGQAALIGSVVVGTIYVHHVAVRSDLMHLAQSVQPLLLALFALLAIGGTRWVRISTWVGLVFVTVFCTFQRHTPLRLFAPWRDRPDLVEYDVAGEKLLIMPALAYYIERVKLVVGRRMAPDDEIFIAPSRPTLYPILEKRSPLPQIYMLWFAPEDEQRAMIAALDARQVRWVFVIDSTVDGRDELHFDQTHPLVWDHVQERYDLLDTPGLRGHHYVFRRRG